MSSYVFAAIFLFCLFLGGFKLRRLHALRGDHQETQSVLTFINDAVIHLAKHQFKWALKVLAVLVVMIIAAKVYLQEFHTIGVMIALAVGVFATYLLSRLILHVSVSTLNAVMSDLSVEQMPQRLHEGVVAMGLFVTGGIGLLATGFLRGISFVYAVENVGFLKKMSFLVPHAQWEEMSKNTLHLTHFLSIETIVCLLALCFGATIYALFVRNFSSLFAKISDIASDTIGRQECQFFEDDLRNPAVLADLVGDQLNNTLGNTLLLFECTLFLMMSTLITSLINTADIHALHGNAHALYGALKQPVLVFVFATLTTLVVLAVQRVLGEKKMRISQMQIAVYGGMFLLSFGMAYLFQTVSLYVVGSVGLGGIIGIGMILFHRKFFSTTSPWIASMLKDSASGGFLVLLSGLKYGAMTVGIGVVTVSGLLYGSVALAESVMGTLSVSSVFHIISLVAFTLVAPTTCLVAMGASSAISDNAKGCANMLMVDEKHQEIVREMDNVCSGSATTMKAFLCVSGMLSVSMLPLFFAKRLSFALAHFEPVFNVNRLVEVFQITPYNYSFLTGVVVGGAWICALCGLILWAIYEGLSRVTSRIREQLHTLEGLWSGSQLPQYGDIVSSIVSPATKWAAVLIGCAIAVGMVSLFVWGVSATLGMMMGMLSLGVVLSLWFLYSGSAWHLTKKAAETDPYYATEERMSVFLMNDVIGDVFKDALAPNMYSLIKVTMVIMILFGGLALN